MSKTPRTDEHILHHGNGNWHPSAFVLASFARQIETELAEARAEIERKDKLIEQMREALEACAEFIHYYDQEHNIGDGKVLEQAIAALSAAERNEGL